MKTALKHSLALAVVALTAWGVLTALAEKREQKTVRTEFNITVPNADPVYDSAGNPATAPNTPLFSNAAGVCDHLFPLIAPDGHHITLGEWKAASGIAQIKCGDKGSHVVLRLSGLVPNGVYTVWLATFQSPGLTPDFANLIGLGALGAPDGSQNIVVASANGDATLSVVHPAGDLSLFGSTGCLSDEFEVLLWLPLHVNGQTYGPEPGNECNLGFQGAFSFK
ncbi:MAG TPA: hypothetical protein VI454_01515 [Verrucomicrobiae bacterium]|jgi:hypothetical protein